MMEKPNIDITGRMAAMAGAVAGTCLVFISGILGQQSTLDLSLRVALYCFTGTLPIALLALILAYNKLDSVWFSVPFWLSLLGVGSGISAALWHIDFKAAAFLGGTIVISITYYAVFSMFNAP